MQKARLDKWDSFVKQNRDALVGGVASAASSAGFREGVFDGFAELLDADYEVKPLDYFSTITDNLAAGCFITDTDRCAVLTTVGTDSSSTEQIADYMEGTDNVIVFDGSTLTGEMVETLSGDFDKVLYICAFIVFALLLISFGRIELALIAFLPLTIGWIWILGIMAIFGINFNIVNIILATFIFGMGDDYTIFITEGAMYEHTYGRKMLHTYKSTIILSALIMFVGIGSLIVAKHPAMLSLAYVIIIGMFTVVLMALIVPPFIYKWLTMKKGRKRKMPVTLLNWFSTFLAFVVFLLGSIFITLAGFFLITLTFGSKKGKELYHKLLSNVSGFIFRNVFFTKHHIETAGEDFSQPAIIVANHQSHLDLMALLQLTPKMVVVTNKWVWNNPLYGILIRYADFCPIENLLTDDLGSIEKKIADGYSVLVFPEGTRTVDGTIGRFHRGAFYLAERFNLDIIPVVLHGINDVLPKENLLLRKGEMTVKVLPRITPEDGSFGEDFKERSKQVRRLMSDTLAGIAAERETADYFADRVIHNYIYKGADIERSVRRNLRENENYRQLAEALPESGRVLFVEPACGEVSLICALVKKNLVIDAVIGDEMTRLLASECVGVPGNLNYMSSASETAAYDMTVEFENGKYSVK
jgi:1-acyl-sn-glycerol-3-phosphate acyltransferase